jgi:hypothetical protein
MEACSAGGMPFAEAVELGVQASLCSTEPVLTPSASIKVDFQVETVAVDELPLQEKVNDKGDGTSDE